VPEIVIAVYRPRPGQEEVLQDLLREHVPYLRAEGLATARPVIHGKALDGSYVEIFEWETGGIDRAHGHPGVHALWQRWAAACDYVALKDLPEAQGLFAGFEPVTL
jgi:hypothetical protein